MLRLLGPDLERRLRACAAGVVLAALGACMVLAGTAAGAGQGEPTLPPEETAPPPAQTQPPPPPVTIPEDPPEPRSTTITLIVPAPPAAKPKRVAAKQAPSSAPAPAKRYRPRRTRSYAEPYTEPAAEPAAPKPTVKRKRKPARPAKRVPAASPLRVAPVHQAVVRDNTRVSAVLGARFSPQTVASSPPDRRAEYLLIVLAVGGSLLLGIAGAAPRLAWYWPEIFVPVIDATERIVLAGVCLAGAALTLAITWALTGPGA
jgi:hypothetical protein